tara:strand:+ start:163 stop:495 length:333 start_codon:yes stop_codon:yes gene_type:complete
VKSIAYDELMRDHCGYDESYDSCSGGENEDEDDEEEEEKRKEMEKEWELEGEGISMSNGRVCRRGQSTPRSVSMAMDSRSRSVSPPPDNGTRLHPYYIYRICVTTTRTLL